MALERLLQVGKQTGTEDEDVMHTPKSSGQGHLGRVGVATFHKVNDFLISFEYATPILLLILCVVGVGCGCHSTCVEVRGLLAVKFLPP